MPVFYGQDKAPGTDKWADAIYRKQGTNKAQFVPQDKNYIAQWFEIGDRRTRMTRYTKPSGGTNVKNNNVNVPQWQGGRNSNTNQYLATINKIRQQFLLMMTGK